MATLEIPRVKELAHRRNDRLEVTLWWIKGTIDTYVNVIDYNTQPPTHYNVFVKSGNSPNDVFNHPFRYIADSPTIELEPLDGRGTQ